MFVLNAGSGSLASRQQMARRNIMLLITSHNPTEDFPETINSLIYFFSAFPSSFASI